MLRELKGGLQGRRSHHILVPVLNQALHEEGADIGLVVHNEDGRPMLGRLGRGTARGLDHRSGLRSGQRGRGIAAALVKLPGEVEQKFLGVHADAERFPLQRIAFDLLGNVVREDEAEVSVAKAG